MKHHLHNTQTLENQKCIVVLCIHHQLAGPQRENFPGGTNVNTGPLNLIGAMPLNHCVCPLSVDIHLKFRMQLGPVKNTTRHKIRLNPAGGAQ